MKKSRSDRYADRTRDGSILVLVLFILALSAALITGMLQLTTEEILQMRNQMGLVRALTVSEAGLDDAFAEIRQDVNWNSGFTNKSFYGDSYSVTVTGTPPSLTVVSTGLTGEGYTARVEARIRAQVAPPHDITIQTIRINE